MCIGVDVTEMSLAPSCLFTSRLCMVLMQIHGHDLMLKREETQGKHKGKKQNCYWFLSSDEALQASETQFTVRLSAL